MSKITLTDLVNLQNENTAVNAVNTNNAVLEAAFDNTISRDGTAPNQMQASLDMNSNRLLNLPEPVSNYEPIRLIDVDTINGGGITVSPLPAGGTTNQILGKVSNTNFDVSWRDTHPVIAGGSTGQVLAKNSATDYDLTWASSSTVASGDGITVTPGSPSIINLRDYKSIKDYGAVGDGVHDDAPAFRAAIADMVSGETLYIPPTNPGYLLNSVVNSAVVTLDNRAISIVGSGWQLKNGGTYANLKGSVFIVGASVDDTSDIIHWKGTDIVTGVTFRDFAICGLSNAFGGDHGRNVIFIDAPTLTGDDFYLANFNMNNVFLCAGKTGYSFKTFSSVSTNHGGGALCFSILANSIMANVRMESVGDSVTIQSCNIGGNVAADARNCGVYFYNGQGVTSTRIINNVFHNFSGSVICDGATLPVITGNECELNNPSVNLHGSMIDLNGGISSIVGAFVSGNTISQNSSVAPYIPLRVANSTGTYIVGNRISVTSGSHITVISTSTNTFVGHGIYFIGGIDNGLILSDSGSFTSNQAVTYLGLCGGTSGRTTLAASAVASGVVTLPATTDTLVGKATTDTLTNKTFDTAGTGNSFSINGVAATANTGTGSVVRATSPTLVTPALGTPSALVGTNITGTAAGLTAGSVTTNANLTGVVTSVGNATSLGSFSSANLATALTDETGSGANVFANTPTLVTPVLGAATGTSLNLSGLTASSAVATDGSKNLVSVTNTGSGSNVLATSPTLVTPVLGAATGTSLNLSGLSVSSAVATDGSKNLVSVTNTGSGNNVLATSPTITTANLVGTATNDNAAAGSVGEYMSNTAGAQTVTSGVAVNSAQVTLTAGDWDVSLWAEALPAATTNITQITASINTTSATHSFAVGDFSVTNYGTAGVVLGSGAASTVTTIPKRISVSSSTVVYGVASTGFTVSTCQMNGFIRARRVR